VTSTETLVGGDARLAIALSTSQLGLTTYMSDVDEEQIVAEFKWLHRGKAV
jgi:hypothetical protein